MAKFFKKLGKFGLTLIPLILFFVLWQVGAMNATKGVLPTPLKVFEQMFKEFTRTKPAMNMGNLTLLGHTAQSLSRIARGYLLAGTVGIVFGFLLGTYFRKLEKLFIPFFRVLEKLNPFAIIPIFMILLGIGDAQKIAIVFWAAVFPILFNTLEGARSVDPQLIRAARSMGTSKFQLFTRIILPSTIPSLFTGLKLAIRVAFFMIIASEVVGSTSGLGWYYGQAGNVYKLPIMYGTILFITVMAIAFNTLFSRLEKHFMKWKEKAL
ncbi:MAG: ABC transporter permease [Oscillospiraceae bacterium]|jgi:NitT/TauT family transport system permease protein|nr:ABC transporter permease [Oscillospiraceae bacterium]